MMINTEKLERLAYSVSEAAMITGLGKTTLYALIKDGRLLSAKLGNRRLIRRSDLDLLISRGTEEATQH